MPDNADVETEGSVNAFVNPSPGQLPTDRVLLGDLTLLVAHHAVTDVEVTTADGVDVRARRTPALVIGPEETLLEIAHDHWGDGGQVVCLARGDSAPAFDRLVRGLRLGVAPVPFEGLEMSEARLLEWDSTRSWGNVRQATVAELDDAAGGSVADLLAPHGVVDWGTRADVLGDCGRRRNFVAATFSWGSAVPPLCVYVLTRVVPLTRALFDRPEVRP